MIRTGASLALAALITAAALWFVLTPETVAEVRRAFATADWISLGVAMGLSAATQWLRAWRFSVLRSGALGLPDATLARIAFQLNFFNFVLPFRLGELSYPVLMRRAYGDSLLHATGILVLARVLDLFTVGAMLLAAAAGLHVSGRLWADIILWLAAAALAILPALVLAAGARGLRVPVPGLSRISEPLASVFAGLRSPAARRAAWGLTVAVWLTFAVLALLAARAVVDGFPAAAAVLGASAGNIAFALPINGIAGLGPSQAAWVAAVTQAGIGWHDALTSALALYVVVLLSAIIFGGIAMISFRSGQSRGLQGPAAPHNR